MEPELEMAGAAVAYSLLLGGPGFPILHPAVYAHLAIRPVDPERVSDHPSAKDIPLNAATVDTKDLIEKVINYYCGLLICLIFWCNASSESEINCILHEEQL